MDVIGNAGDKLDIWITVVGWGSRREAVRYLAEKQLKPE